jgi:hypothetical protein
MIMLMLSHKRTAQMSTTALAILLHTLKEVKQRMESDTFNEIDDDR